MVLDISWIGSFGLLGLFIVNFLAFTILPIPVEAAIIIASFIYNPFLVLFVAILGSTAGSLTTYYIGYKGVRRFLPKSKKEWKYNAKARELFEKYGAWSLLLFGWLPLIGDPLIIIAGSFGMKVWKFLIYSIIGRAIYFILIIYLGINLEGVL